jgi:WD40 repeat protein
VISSRLPFASPILYCRHLTCAYTLPHRPAIVILLVLLFLWCFEVRALSPADTVSTAHQGSRGGVLRAKAEFNLSPKDASVIKWSPDSRYVATGGLFNDGVQVFDVGAGKQVMFLKKNMPGSLALAWSPDGRYIAAGNYGTGNSPEKRSVYIWDAKTGDYLKTILGPFTPGNAGENDAKSLAFSPNGKYLAVTYVGRLGRDGEYIYLYDVENGSPLKSFANSKVSSTRSPLIFSPDGRYLIEGATSGEIRLWNVATAGLYKSIKAHAYDITAVAVSPDGRSLVSATSTGEIRGHLDKATGKYSKVKIEDQPRIWNAVTGTLLKTLEGYPARINGALEFTPNGRYLISGSDDQSIRVWETATWQLADKVRVLEFPMSLGVSPNGQYVAVGAGNRLIVWEITK